MNQRYISVCPNCHSFYSVEKSQINNACEDCGNRTVLVDFDHDTYMSFTPEQKENFKAEYVKSFSDTPSFNPMPQSGWVSYINWCGIVSLVLFLLVGIFCILSGLFWYGIVSIIVGALSSGSLILFAIVAEDVRHIRNRVDQFYYEAENEKIKRTV